MLTPEADALRKKQATEEFLVELAKLINKYRPNIPAGSLVGALEIVKMRIFWQTAENIKGNEEEK